MVYLALWPFVGSYVAEIVFACLFVTMRARHKGTREVMPMTW